MLYSAFAVYKRIIIRVNEFVKRFICGFILIFPAELLENCLGGPRRGAPALPFRAQPERGAGGRLLRRRALRACAGRAKGPSGRPYRPLRAAPPGPPFAIAKGGRNFFGCVLRYVSRGLKK